MSDLKKESSYDYGATVFTFLLFIFFAGTILYHKP